QSGYSSAFDIANVEVLVAVHITAERVPRGHIQQITFRAAYAAPSRHEAAARRRRRRTSFISRGNFIRARNLGRALRPHVRLMRGGVALERCSGKDVALR